MRVVHGVRRSGLVVPSTLALASMLALAAMLSACGGTGGGTGGGAGGGGKATTEPSPAADGAEGDTAAATPPPAPPVLAASVLTLRVTGLQPLAGAHYEGWALLGNERVSTGKFNVAQDGSLQSLTGTPIEAFALDRDIAAASQFTVTIEPDGDADASPGPTVVLAGTMQTGRAVLAFPVALSGVSGAYVLGTPTDGPGDNEAGGVWFLDPAGPRPSLVLPELPAGWAYEGWAATQGATLSAGRFRAVAGPDGAAPYSGPQPAPPFPGEDFLVRLPEAVRPPVNLADGASTVAVSLEPDIGGRDPTGDAPFWLTPLRSAVPSALAPATPAPLEAAPGAPSGVATVG